MLLKLRVFLFNCLTPVLKWTATLHMPFTHKNITGVDYYKIWPLLKPGLLFCTKIRGELTTLLVPGNFSHVGGYCPIPGSTVDENVVQAERDGVHRIDFVSFLLSKDEVAVLEPNCFGDKKDLVMARAAEIASTYIGAPYDFQFDSQDTTDKSFYCSGLWWAAYDQAAKEFGFPSMFTPIMELGDLVMTPQAFADCKNMTILYHGGS